MSVYTAMQFTGLIPFRTTPKLQGVCCFANDPLPPRDISKLSLRMSVPESEVERTKFYTLCGRVKEVVALLDGYRSFNSIVNRLEFARRCPNVQWVEILNETPHMPYGGEQVKNEVQMLDIVNLMNDRAHSLGLKTCAMAPANILQNGNTAWGIDAWGQLKDLTLYTKCDAVAIHVYEAGLKGMLRINRLKSELTKWQDEADAKFGYRKQLWCTETGALTNHEDFAVEWVSRVQNALKPAKTYWYRLAAFSASSGDAGYALWTPEQGMSPAWRYVEGAT